eukprot:7868156-Ditylum_brightwellii.AAC.1
MLLHVFSATCVASWFSRTGGGVFCLHPFVPGLQVVVLDSEHCNVVDGLALLGGVVLWCAIGATGRAKGAKIPIGFMAG